MPRVSVIIPTYNCDRFLPEAIDSVLMQTYQDYEIIVVDDGSTDQTCQVLEHYRNKIRYFYQENQGSAVARNLGIKEAKGELIAFLDADDFFLTTKLEKQVICFEQTSDLGMVICGWRLVTENKQFISDVKMWDDAPTINLKTAILYKPARPSATLVRKSYCEKLGGFNSNFLIGEDLDFLLNFILQGCLTIWVQDVLVCYRQHHKSLMAQGSTVVKNSEAVMDHFFSNPNLPLEISQLQKQERYQSLVWLACRMYYDGYLDEMLNCFHKAWLYRPLSRTRTIEEWMKSLSNYGKLHGHQFNAYEFSNSVQWQQLIGYL